MSAFGASYDGSSDSKGCVFINVDVYPGAAVEVTGHSEKAAVETAKTPQSSMMSSWSMPSEPALPMDPVDLTMEDPGN